jgi:hypothetical protein
VTRTSVREYLAKQRERYQPVLRQNSVRRQVIDLSELIRRRSRLNGHSPAPPASTPPDALRRPPYPDKPQSDLSCGSRVDQQRIDRLNALADGSLPADRSGNARRIRITGAREFTTW